MAVYEYKNSAWQETSETPKKYVNGAWEDSDGYAYENGAWAEKWSAFPSNYLIKDGVINPQAQYVNEAQWTLGADDYLWRYDSTEQALVSACKVQRVESGNYNQSIWLRVQNMFLGSQIAGKRMWIDYKVVNGRYDSSRDRYCMINWVSDSRHIYQTSRSTAYYDVPAVAATNNPNGTYGTLRLYAGYTSASITVATGYIYNLWYE